MMATSRKERAEVPSTPYGNGDDVLPVWHHGKCSFNEQGLGEFNLLINFGIIYIYYNI